jgi:hypothetical protein
MANVFDMDQVKNLQLQELNSLLKTIIAAGDLKLEATRKQVLFVLKEQAIQLRFRRRAFPSK